MFFLVLKEYFKLCAFAFSNFFRNLRKFRERRKAGKNSRLGKHQHHRVKPAKLLSTVIFRPFSGITKTKAPALLEVRADRLNSPSHLLIVDGFPLLEVFFLLRRYPVTVQSVSDLLFHCPSVTCLDISSIPLAFLYFETFLPRMPRLQLSSFTGNELLGTENIIRSLAINCIDLQVICVNYFHSTNNIEIERSFVFLLQRCRKLKEVILNGLFVNSLVVSIRSFAYYQGHPTRT